MKKNKVLKVNELVKSDSSLSGSKISFSKNQDDGLFEMSNYGTKVTGLPMVIWAGAPTDQHGPSIKVQKTYNQKMDPYNMFSVSISNNPKIEAGDQGDISNSDLQKVYKWIRLNKAPLMRLWNLEYLDFDEFKSDIKKI